MLPGWLTSEATMLLAWINKVQFDNDLHGNLFEIGVHHGKSAIVLRSLCRDDEVLAVCDLFDSQEGNVSGSGSGSRAIFEQNLAKHFGSDSGIKIFEQSSGSLLSEQIGSAFRIFHIDGGHNADEALSDLKLGSVATVPGGVMIVDDPFRPEWPGVTEAIIEFLQTDRDWCAIVVGFNKVILVRKAFANKYLQSIDDKSIRQAYKLDFPFSYKKLPFLNSELRIFYLQSTYDRPHALFMAKCARSIRKLFRKNEKQ